MRPCREGATHGNARHTISAILCIPCTSKRRNAQKQWKMKRSNHDGASWLEPYKNNGILTSRQGIGVPNAGRFEAPAERHRGYAIFRSYQLWLEFSACAGSRTAPIETIGDPLGWTEMLCVIRLKIPENG